MGKSLSDADINGEDDNGAIKKMSSFFSVLKNGPSSALQFRFRDRIFAANILSAILQDKMGKELEKEDNTLLGISRGGIIIASIIAKKLKIKNFDIVIPRKLTDIDNKEQAIGAILEDGTTYLYEKLISELQIDTDYLELEKKNNYKKSNVENHFTEALISHIIR